MSGNAGLIARADARLAVSAPRARRKLRAAIVVSGLVSVILLSFCVYASYTAWGRTHDRVVLGTIMMGMAAGTEDACGVWRAERRHYEGSRPYRAAYAGISGIVPRSWLPQVQEAFAQAVEAGNGLGKGALESVCDGMVQEAEAQSAAALAWFQAAIRAGSVFRN